MKRIAEIFLAHQLSPSWRWPRVSFLLPCLFLCYNHCEAQNAQTLLMKGSGNPKLSGIYSSMKNEASPLNSLSKEDGALREKGKGSTNFLPHDFPINNQHYKEEIEKRTFTSRTFQDNQGSIVIQYGSKNLNYLDNENKFQPIDAKLKTSPLNPLSEGEGLRHEKGKESDTGRGFWEATQQQFPTHLYRDGSTAISSDEKNKIIFNRNCKINGLEINYSDFTVGEEGMLIHNAIAGIDKKIIFYENMIETDYSIGQPINTGNLDLVISEEIELPEGYYASAINPNSGGGEAEIDLGRGDDYVVYSPDNKEMARFKAPIFYDASNAVVFGKYKLIQENKKLTTTSISTPLQLEQVVQEGKVKYILQIIIPNQWLSDVNRAYPITIDPIVTGPISNYPSVYLNSCVLPSYASDSMLVTIPGKITIDSFFVEDSYFADAFKGALMKYGHMVLSTACGSVSFSCQGTAADSSGTCYLIPHQDLASELSCCFNPSCSPQTFYLKHALARNNYGTGCNHTYIYYSPYGPFLFSAYIKGRTVETAQTQWSVSADTICSNICSISLNVITKYGVPPYTVTHPWATGSAQYGTAIGSCNSSGSHIIALTIPNCPTTCGTNIALSIPPPIIYDVCGDTVTGLSPKSIIVKPVPVATANTVSVCSGDNLSIPVSSCITGSTFHWTGSNGTSNNGNIFDNVVNSGATPIIIHYFIIPSANGCVGPIAKDSAQINPLPLINAGAGDTIEAGVSAQLNATGGLTYLWSPSTGLSCTNCPNPTVATAITTSYYLFGTNEQGCSGNDTVTIFVTQGGEVLYIPNSFSPNDNYINELFCVYGTSIKTIDIKIYDRWGELVFHSTDIKQGWDGKLRGKNVEGGVYVYAVNCEWLSGASAYRNGIVTVLR